ncbi:phosphoesterase [Leptospira langatensis]|uniref:Phosphoesterase n=1 Tax=Leptospira langatensis TaxID=2484983 RepID=A0A5F2A065_9LEPT|nr:phosphoesterase [Leptospira langatensis]TGK04223.1 phosphoesterase [Leptospira langatensis]TGL43703.1 phosphoesterase [Leptospira langatensis]
MKVKILKKIVIFFSIILISVAAFNLWTSLQFRVLHKGQPHQTGIKNPYEKTTKIKWAKTAIHLHTNEIWYTPLRNSSEEILEIYRNFGYKILAFTDYGKITKPNSSDPVLISGYEWGRNLKKRHLTILGPEKVESDFFPLYSSLDNIQWEINVQKEKGSFVVVNHPTLYNGFTLSELERLSGYDAIEVLSPYGDIFKYWDELLSQGIHSFCMSGDDLHYLPKAEYVKITSKTHGLREKLTLLFAEKGEALTRYILLNTDSYEQDDILKALKSGNYACVRKLKRNLDDPKLKSFYLKNGNEVHFEFEDTPFFVEFIGVDGQVLHSLVNQKAGFYKAKPKDFYVRIQALLPTGTVFSNPFYVNSNE